MKMGFVPFGSGNVSREVSDSFHSPAQHPQRVSPPATQSDGYGVYDMKTETDGASETPAASYRIRHRRDDTSSSDDSDGGVRSPPPEAGGRGGSGSPEANGVVRKSPVISPDPIGRWASIPATISDDSDNDARRSSPSGPDRRSSSTQDEPDQDERLQNGDDHDELLESERDERNGRGSPPNGRDREARSPRSASPEASDEADYTPTIWDIIPMVGEEGYEMPEPSNEMQKLTKLLTEFGYEDGSYADFFRSLSIEQKRKFVGKPVLNSPTLDATCFVKGQPQPDTNDRPRCTSCLKEEAEWFIQAGVATGGAFCVECATLAKKCDEDTTGIWIDDANEFRSDDEEKDGEDPNQGSDGDSESEFPDEEEEAEEAE